MTLAMDYTSLKPHFTAEEIRIYFGARTQAEIDEAARFMESMTSGDRVKFKQALRDMNIMRLTEKSYGKQ